MLHPHFLPLPKISPLKSNCPFSSFFSSFHSCINSPYLSSLPFSFVYLHVIKYLCGCFGSLTWLLWSSFHALLVTLPKKKKPWLIWCLFKQQIGPQLFPNRPTISAYNYILRLYLSVSPTLISFSITVLTQFYLSGLCGLHLTLSVKGISKERDAKRDFKLSSVVHSTLGISAKAALIHFL